MPASRSADRGDTANPGDEWALSVILSFIAAFVDATCYLALFRTFTAFITGTMIILAAEVVHADDEFIPKLVVMIGFVVSLFGWVFLIQRCFTWRHLPAALLVTEAVLLMLYTSGGVLLGPLERPEGMATILLAVLAVLAMSLQNAVMAMILRAQVPTTVMTVNLTRFMIGFVAGLGRDRNGAANENAANSRARDNNARGKEETRRPPSGSVRNYAWVLAAFMVGALAGAYGFVQWGFIVVACPVILLFLLAARCLARSRRTAS